MRVSSVRGRKVLEKGEVYVGRTCGGFEGSVLGNRFRRGVDGTKDERIGKYREWLWAELKKGEGAVFEECMRLKGSHVLSCWCADLSEGETYEGKLVCHAQVVARAIRWLESRV